MLTTDEDLIADTDTVSERRLKAPVPVLAFRINVILGHRYRRSLTISGKKRLAGLMNYLLSNSGQIVLAPPAP